MALDTLRTLWAVARAPQSRLLVLCYFSRDSSVTWLPHSPLTDSIILRRLFNLRLSGSFLKTAISSYAPAGHSRQTAKHHPVLMTPSAHRTPWAQSTWPQCHPDCISQLSAISVDNWDQVCPFFGINTGTSVYLHSDLQRKDRVLQREKGENVSWKGATKWICSTQKNLNIAPSWHPQLVGGWVK